VRYRVAAVFCVGSFLVLALSCSGPSTEGRRASETERTPDRVYHVQLDMMKDKSTANHTLTEALEWWKGHKATLQPEPLSSSTSPGEAPAQISWKAPRYRVRLGPFASRAQAQTVLDAVRPSFPEAFVAPDRRRADR
jgi:hypothetical protein